MNAHEKRGFSRVVGRRWAFSRFGDGNIRRQVSVDVFLLFLSRISKSRWMVANIELELTHVAFTNRDKNWPGMTTIEAFLIGGTIGENHFKRMSRSCERWSNKWCNRRPQKLENCPHMSLIFPSMRHSHIHGEKLKPSFLHSPLKSEHVTFFGTVVKKERTKLFHCLDDDGSGYLMKMERDCQIMHSTTTPNARETSSH